MKKELLLLPDFIPGETEKQRFYRARKEIFKWMKSQTMQILLAKEGYDRMGYEDEELWYEKEFPEIHRFVTKKWDKRNNKERFEVSDCRYSAQENADLIDILERLGFVNAMDIHGNPDHIWILGGARMANYERVCRAKEIADTIVNVKEISVITAYRQLSPLESDATDTFAPRAETEKDALMASVKRVFGISEESFVIDKYEDEDPFLCSSVERFVQMYGEIPVTVYQAPSAIPGKRANSRDTFEFHLKKRRYDVGTSVYAVSSSAFVPYQYISFFDLAIKNRLNVEFGGNAYVSRNEMKLNAADILQEVKASFDAVSRYLNML